MYVAPYADDAQVPRGPGAGRVEEQAGVRKIHQPVVGERGDPDVQQNLAGRDPPRLALEHDDVVEREERGHEEDLERRLVSRHPKTAERVRGPDIVTVSVVPRCRSKRHVWTGLVLGVEEARPLLAVDAQAVPEHDVPFPDAVDDSLHRRLGYGFLGSDDDRNLQGVHAAERVGCIISVRLMMVWMLQMGVGVQARRGLG